MKDHLLDKYPAEKGHSRRRLRAGAALCMRIYCADDPSKFADIGFNEQGLIDEAAVELFKSETGCQNITGRFYDQVSNTLWGG